MSLINNILEEWAYRVDNGMPNPNNPNHINELSQILIEMGLSEITDELIKNLSEAEAQFTNPLLNKKVKYIDKDGKSTEGIIGNLLRLDSDHPGRKAAEAQLPPKDSEERKQLNKDLGSQNQASPIQPKSKDGKEEPTTDSGAQQNPKAAQQAMFDPKSDPAMAARLDTEKQILQKISTADDEVDVDTDGEAKFDVEQVSTKNENSINGFIERGYSKSKGAPGSPGSMLNELVSIKSATNSLNSKKEFDYESELASNVELLKGSGLGGENDGNNPSGKKTSTESKVVAQKYGISIALASKIIIATKAAEKKHNRIKSQIIEKNGLENTTSIPLFGDGSGLQRQRDIVSNTNGIIKLGNTEISKEEALDIINASGGGKNPSDTAIFTIDDNTGDLYMSFFSDKDGTNAIVAQSSIKAENESKKSEIDNLVKEGKLTEEKANEIKSSIDSKIAEHEKLEKQLNDVVSAPGKHLETQNIDSLVELTKTLSKGSIPDKYWNDNVVKKFASNKKWGEKKSWDYLPPNHSEPPTDTEMMKGFINYVNDLQNAGNLSKPEQRIVTDLSNATNGPKLGAQIGEIRKQTVQTDLSLIEELNKTKIKLENGNEVGLGTMLEAQSVSEKLHFDMLFGGDGVYQDSTAFCQESGGVTVDKEAMGKCLPFESREDVFSHFEIGEERETVQKGSEIITGGSRIVYAITKDGVRYAIGEKKQRSKTGPLGKLQTVYNFHPDLQKCFDSNGK